MRQGWGVIIQGPSRKLLFAQFWVSLPPPPKRAQNEDKSYKILKIDIFPPGGGDRDFMDRAILWTSGRFWMWMNQARKNSTKITFFVPETAGWGGGLPPKGVGVEKFVPSLESLSSLGFEERNLECPRNFAGMSRTLGGVQKVCAKKFVCIFRSLIICPPPGPDFSQKTFLRERRGGVCFEAPHP